MFWQILRTARERYGLFLFVCEGADGWEDGVSQKYPCVHVWMMIDDARAQIFPSRSGSFQRLYSVLAVLAECRLEGESWRSLWSRPSMGALCVLCTLRALCALCASSGSPMLSTRFMRGLLKKSRLAKVEFQDIQSPYSQLLVIVIHGLRRMITDRLRLL